MVILQKMGTASSFSLFRPPLLLQSPPKRFASISQLQPETRARNFGSVYKKKNGTSLSTSFVAIESPTVLQSDGPQNKEAEKIVLPTNESSEGLLRIRHTCAHVMAMAVQKLYPHAKVTIGPWIDNGFYYDFDMEPSAMVIGKGGEGGRGRKEVGWEKQKGRMV